MYNYFMLIGNIVDVETFSYQNNKKCSLVTLKTQREFRSSNGEYVQDRITVKCWDTLADLAAEYCKIGAKVGCKGRIQPTSYTRENKAVYSYDLIVDRLMVMSNNNE